MRAKNPESKSGSYALLFTYYALRSCALALFLRSFFSRFFITLITSRPLYVPQFGQAIWGIKALPHFAQLTSFKGFLK